MHIKLLLILFFLLSASGVAADIRETQVPLDDTLTKTFGFGPKCRFVFPAVHVYDVDKTQFISGAELLAVYPGLVNETINWEGTLDKCKNLYTVAELEKKFDFKLNTIKKYIVFFIDLPTPFATFQEKAVLRREQLFKTFQALDDSELSRVWLQLPEFVIE